MYPSRITGVGIHRGNPIASFTLSSKSIPYRQLNFTKNKTRINVFPKYGYEDHPTNQDPEVDHYSCIVTGNNPIGDFWAVTFNGHMAKRTSRNLADGMSPFVALDMTLLDFRGAPFDARIGGVVYIPSTKEPSFWLGTSDTDNLEKRIVGYPSPRKKTPENKLYFMYDKNTDLESCFEMNDKPMSENELAQYIHENILGGNILFGLGTGVAVFQNGKFNLGIYNKNFNESDVQKWEEQYKKIKP